MSHPSLGEPAVRLAPPRLRPDPLGAWPELIHAAVESEDPSVCVEAAARAVGASVGLVGAAGQVLGQAPRGPAGRRAAAIAAAAGTPAPASAVLRGAPAGWRVVPIMHGGARLGVLAVGPVEGEGSDEQSVDLVATLIGEQLKRTSLVHAQAAALLRRLIRPPGLDARRVRRDAAALGLALADAYWPAVLVWDVARAPATLVERLHRDARSLTPGGLTTALGRRVVLLHPAGGDSGDAGTWFATVVGRIRAASSASGAYAIAADRPVELAALAGEIAQLDGLCELGPRGGADCCVVPAREYALDRLFRQIIATPEARSFVDHRLGALIAWDREHGSDLLRVLEAALDVPRHDQAARRCFMHRNTFRHRLRLALEVLDDPLEDPDTRLAVHVALKLRAGGCA